MFVIVRHLVLASNLYMVLMLEITCTVEEMGIAKREGTGKCSKLATETFKMTPDFQLGR